MKTKVDWTDGPEFNALECAGDVLNYVCDHPKFRKLELELRLFAQKLIDDAMAEGAREYADWDEDAVNEEIGESIYQGLRNGDATMIDVIIGG